MVELGTGLLAEREDRKPQDMPDEDCTAPATSPGDIARTVKDMKRALELTSICGLGTSVSNPLASYLQFFAPKPEGERKSR
jgi:NADH:ubiquinone oxidoreductase subunit F (NADH-binding)